MTSSSKRNKKKEPDPVEVERDRVALAKYIERRKNLLSARVKIPDGDGVAKLALDHPDKRIGQMHLMQAFATADHDFAYGILTQLANAGSRVKDVDEAEVNFMLSVIKGIEPKDQIETMLAAQMATVHMATMTFASRLAHVESIEQQDSAERSFNKLLRTFGTQMETLKRYRTGGEQKVTVQHVSVSEGGQAIVGNVTQSGQDHAPDKAPASPLAITDKKTAPMQMIGESEARTGVPVRRRRRDK